MNSIVALYDKYAKFCSNFFFKKVLILLQKCPVFWYPRYQQTEFLQPWSNKLWQAILENYLQQSDLIQIFQTIIGNYFRLSETTLSDYLSQLTKIAHEIRTKSMQKILLYFLGARTPLELASVKNNNNNNKKKEGKSF